MSKHYISGNTYVVLVDAYRRPSRKRNTAGRYLVGAKTPQEAEHMLKKAIGFGSCKTYYKVEKENERDIFLQYGEMFKIDTTASGGAVFKPVKKATDPSGGYKDA